MRKITFHLLFAVLIACAFNVQAQTWTGNGIPIPGNISGTQDEVALCCTKVHDGIIYVWRDTRTGSNSQDIYAQKFTPCGVAAPGWPVSGVLICNATGNQQFPQIVPDGSDGAFITWQDTRGADWDIYAQHITGAGTIAGGWPANGLGVCVLPGNQQNPHLCIDGSGGTIISWDDQRSGDWDVWSQRINSGGGIQWGLNGKIVITQSSTQNNNAIAPDSIGGAFYVWEDSRTGSASIDIYGMHLDGSGASYGSGWGSTAAGAALSTLSTSQKYPGVVCTGTVGGNQTAIFYWADPNGSGENIKATRMTGLGAIYTPGSWVANGIIVGFAITSSGNPGTATYPVGAADCSGGFYCSWQSNYSSSDHDVLSQHIGFNGVPIGGIQYTAFNTDIEKNDMITPDGFGGAVDTWQDQWPPAIVWNRKFGSGAVLASGIQSSASQNPNITAMGGVWYTAWEDSRPVVLGSYDIYGISSSALGPPPLLNSNLTINYNTYSCSVVTQTVSACAGTAINFSCPLPAGLFNTYTFKDGISVLQTGSSNTFSTSALTVGSHTITVVSSTSAGCSTAPSNQIIVNISNGPSVSLTSSGNVSCNGGTNGTATINATGGNPGYTYLWSPSGGTTVTASGLGAGTYTCTVTDALGCVQTQTVTLTQPSAITGSPTTNPATCGNANGSATVTAGGGTPGYTYSWSPSGGNAATASGLVAGNYTCTITDANGCTHITPVTINNSGGPTVTLSSSGNISCNGGNNGTATVNATGGTGPYTYSWSPSGGTSATASGLTTGTYTCIVTDANGCVQSQTVTITQPTILSATISQSNLSCSGGSNGSSTVVASGGTSAYSYSWSPSGGTAATASGLTAGSYTCTITDANGCVTTQSATITAPPALTVTPSQSNVSCNGSSSGSATVVVGGGTPSYSYSWAPSGGTAATENSLTSGNYTCTITDANGCITTQSFAITQPPVITATTSSSNATCGNSNGSATVTPSGGISPYSYSWTVTGGTAQTDSNLPAGTYTCIITDANGCGLTSTVTVGTTAGPTVSVASQIPTSCNGGSNATATLSVTGGTGPFTYSWAPSGGNAITGTGLSAGTYTCTVTDANGCITTQQVTITQPTVVTGTTSSIDATCGNTNGSATANASGGTPGYTYSWSPSGGNAATAPSLGAGIYNCTVTDANGCSTVLTVGVNNIGGPTVVLTSQVDNACNGGNNGSALVTASGGNPGYTYAWTPSGGTAASATSLSAGNYQCTVTDASGCIQTQTVTITEPPAITASITSIDATCGNNNGSSVVSASGGTGAFTYNWLPSGGTAATASGLSAGTYSCIITDANGCNYTAITTINSIGSPVVTLQSQTNVSCFGGFNGSATVNVTGGNGPYTYSWTSGGTAATESGLAMGTYTCTITDANSCVVTQTVSITQPVALTYTSTDVDATCGNNNGSATLNVSGGTGPYTYTWSPSGGNAASATNLSAGNYSCLIIDANGCSSITNDTILSLGGPTVTLQSQIDDACFNGTNGSATVNVTGGTPGYTYSWSSGGTAQTENNLGAGTYTCTVTDAGGCVQTQTVTITQPTSIAVTPSSTGAGCFGGTNGTATVVASGGTPGYTYSWTPSGGTGATANGLTAGNYTCTITDANGCTVTQPFAITQPTAIVPAATSAPACGANNGTATASATGGTGPYTYSWAPSGGTNATVTGLASGTYTCTITDANGCTQTTTVAVTTNPLPAIGVSPDVTILIGTSTDLTASGGVSYVWSPSTSLNCPTCQNTTANPSQTTVYCVQGTDANGCADTACMTVTVNTDCGELFIPTAFSPNDDHENDVLCIYGKQCIKEMDFIIYDRWGEKVYESTNPDDCWDGKYKGEMMNSGVFVYYLNATMLSGQQVVKKGNVTLVR
jgi:gliding motility-associated-like protein